MRNGSGWRADHRGQRPAFGPLVGPLVQPTGRALFVDYTFPTEGHLREYVETVGDRSEEEVRRLLLKPLIPSTSMGCDKRHLAGLRGAEKTAPRP